MEWTDGMEYQLTKIAKTHYRGRGEVVSTVLPLLTSTGLLCLTSMFSSLVPRPNRGIFCMWMMLCLAWITLSMVLAAWMPGDMCGNLNKPKFAVPNYGPAFGRSYLHVASDECMLVDMIWVWHGSTESNPGHDSEGSACATYE